MSLPRAVLVDIDGTLAYRCDRSPFDWARVGEDTPNTPIIKLVRVLARTSNFHIIVMSGRDEICRPQTALWLDRYHVPFNALHMRRHKDKREDAIVKRELYEQHVHGRYTVRWVIDDRNQVVDMWRNQLGLTVLQCADGDF